MRVVETRRIDSLGQIVLPIEVRMEFEIGKNSDINICVNGDEIVLKKAQPSCVICKSTNKLKNFGAKYLCLNCVTEIRGE